MWFLDLAQRVGYCMRLAGTTPLGRVCQPHWHHGSQKFERNRNRWTMRIFSKWKKMITRKIAKSRAFGLKINEDMKVFEKMFRLYRRKSEMKFEFWQFSSDFLRSWRVLLNLTAFTFPCPVFGGCSGWVGQFSRLRWTLLCWWLLGQDGGRFSATLPTALRRPGKIVLWALGLYIRMLAAMVCLLPHERGSIDIRLVEKVS